MKEALGMQRKIRLPGFARMVEHDLHSDYELMLLQDYFHFQFF